MLKAEDAHKMAEELRIIARSMQNQEKVAEKSRKELDPEKVASFIRFFGAKNGK